MIKLYFMICLLLCLSSTHKKYFSCWEFTVLITSLNPILIQIYLFPFIKMLVGSKKGITKTPVSAKKTPQQMKKTPQATKNTPKTSVMKATPQPQSNKKTPQPQSNKKTPQSNKKKVHYIKTSVIICHGYSLIVQIVLCRVLFVDYQG